MNDSPSNVPGLFGDAPDSNYLVLARKYRPRTFADLVGQEAMVRTIANSFALGRIAHATMLTGVRGVGKTTTARLIARALNYKRGDIDQPTIDLDPPGENCQAIMESRHPDVFEMDAASRTGIGDIREILDSVRYAPVMARHKVYIIDEVHMLSTAAFNGLLKTLEEPPPHVKFIFATTEIRKVPVTVLSRCQRFDLKRIDAGRLAEHLGAICEKEHVDVEPEGLMLIARAAEGSARDALSLLDQAIVQKSGARVGPEDIRVMIGLADRARSLDLFDAIARADARTALTQTREQYDRGADPGLIVRDLLDIAHETARAQALGGAAHIIGGAEWRARIEALGAALSPAQLSRLWQMLLKALDEAGAAPDPIAAVEMAMVRLCAAQSLPPPEEAARLLREAQGSGAVGAPAGGGGAGQGPRLGAFEDVAALAAGDVKFELVLDRLKVLSFSQGEIVYAAEPDHPADLPRRLMGLIKDATGEIWRVRAEAAPAPTPVASLAERRRMERQRELDALKAHPFVAEALKCFPGAEIVAVRKPETDAPAAQVVALPKAEAKDARRKKEADL